MGFFGDLWSGIKNLASNVWSGVKSVASNVYDGVKSAGDWIAQRVQPILGTIGRYAPFIPVIGTGIAAAANAVNTGIGTARSIIDRVGEAGRSIRDMVDGNAPQGEVLGALRRRFQRAS